MTGAGATLLLVLYYGVLAIAAVYGLHRYAMLFLFYRHGRSAQLAEMPAVLPAVTVQLPVFNEIYVVERLIGAVCRLDYPKALVEIQVLDDSDDETGELVARLVAARRAEGWDIHHLARPHREGFKAGALGAGLARARGELIFIFDADFVPPPGILRACLPAFADARVGMVQARWEHINRDYSLLTRVQSLFLDGHFAIEQAARHRSGRFFNFNGTAGMWRAAAIRDAGGWQFDTLTEDLDLSYRAQLAGWKFVYLEEQTAPAELPVDIDAFKSQQHRWTKGSVQTGRKLLGRILASPLGWRVKLESVFHLTNNFAYLFMMLLATLVFPAMLLRRDAAWQGIVFVDLPLFLVATFSVVAFYLASQREIGRSWLSAIPLMPALMAVGVGLSVNNARGVIEALAGRSSGFTRTPKYCIEGSQGEWAGKKYRAPRNISRAIEAVFALYFLMAVGFALGTGMWLSLPFLLVFLSGFGYMVALGAKRLP